MKFFKIVLLKIMLSCSIAFGQYDGDIVVTESAMESISAEKLQYLRYGKIEVHKNAELFFKNSVVRADHVDLYEDASIYLDNSIIIWYRSSNAEGDLIGKANKGIKIKDLFVAGEGEYEIRKDGEKIVEGSYDYISNMVLWQGIYYLYSEGKLKEIIYAY